MRSLRWNPSRSGGKLIAGVEDPMPNYEYHCASCEKSFSKVLTINEHDRGTVKCPYCGSEKVEQTYSAFFAVTSKKSA
jgi:putative FmdB family regulatory protein